MIIQTHHINVELAFIWWVIQSFIAKTKDYLKEHTGLRKRRKKLRSLVHNDSKKTAINSSSHSSMYIAETTTL